MTVKNAPGFARDAGERALKTAIQAGIPAAILFIDDLRKAVPGLEEDNPDSVLLVVLAIVPVLLSALTSWLSRFRGDPATASSRRIV